MTAEKRREKRFRKRLRIVFESDQGRIGGYTTNLSPHGMQVASAVVLPPGTQVRGKIELPDGRELAIETRVRWARKTQGTFAILREKSMGLQILGQVPAELLQLLEGAREDTRRITDDGAGPPPAGRTAAAPDPPAPAAVRPREASEPGAARAPAPRTPAPVTVAPIRSAVAAIPPPALRPPEPGRIAIPLALAPGLEGTVMVPVTERDTPLTPTQAAGLIERAAAQALEPHLGTGLQTRGQDLSLSIVDFEPLPVAARLQARAKVVKVEGRVIELAVDLSVGGRAVATARHTRIIVRKGAA